MKSKTAIIAVFLLILSGCGTLQQSDTAVKYGMNTLPGPEYEYIGEIILGGFVMDSSGQKIASSTPFAAFSEDHAVRKMKEMTFAAGGDYIVILDIRQEGSGDSARFFGSGKAYKLKESFGKKGEIILTEKGLMVQYVLKMEPGADYKPIAKMKNSSGVESGNKGELVVNGRTENEAIVILRNTAAEFGANLVVIDGITKDEKSASAVFNAKGRIFQLKK